VDVVAEMFDKNDSFYLMVTPEGTRKLSKKWRRGFYEIAMKADVPIGCVYLDYRKREVGLGLVLTPSGDFDKDLALIQDFYRKKAMPRHPDRFNLSAMYEDE
jgi:1-acyl-sn-glycerol-3-phosphate acyltransferase